MGREGRDEGKEAVEGRMGGKLEVLIDEVKIGGRGQTKPEGDFSSTIFQASK